MKKYVFVPESKLIAVKMWAICSTFTSFVFCILFLYILNEWNRIIHSIENI